MTEFSPSIAIAGSTGFLGSALFKALTLRGLPVKRLIRVQPHQDTSKEVYWNPASGHIERVGLEGVDVVINLVGAPIAGRRWSDTRKKLLYQSRVESTRLLSRTIAKLKKPPRLMLSASAIGYYGNDPREVVNESSDKGEGFLANLCVDWEQATEEAQQAGVRVVHLRTGAVLGPGGGMLKRLLTWFRIGLGASLGSGTQPMSWISLDDWVSACEYLIFQSKLSGPVNLSSQHPVSNFEFSTSLAKALHRKAWLRIPERLILWRYGEMGKELMLGGRKVEPKKLLDAGFKFNHPTLKQALNAILS